MKCEQEKKLVTRFKSGDADAFGMLFKLYAPKLGSFCLGLVSKEDAENIVQDVFLKLWETRKKNRSLTEFWYVYHDDSP